MKPLLFQPLAPKWDAMPDHTPLIGLLTIPGSEIPDSLADVIVSGKFKDVDELVSLPFVPHTNPQVTALDPISITMTGILFVPKVLMDNLEGLELYFKNTKVVPSPAPIVPPVVAPVVDMTPLFNVVNAVSDAFNRTAINSSAMPDLQFAITENIDLLRSDPTFKEVLLAALSDGKNKPNPAEEFLLKFVRDMI